MQPRKLINSAYSCSIHQEKKTNDQSICLRKHMTHCSFLSSKLVPSKTRISWIIHLSIQYDFLRRTNCMVIPVSIIGHQRSYSQITVKTRKVSKRMSNLQEVCKKQRGEVRSLFEILEQRQNFRFPSVIEMMISLWKPPHRERYLDVKTSKLSWKIK